MHVFVVSTASYQGPLACNAGLKVRGVKTTSNELVLLLFSLSLLCLAAAEDVEQDGPLKTSVIVATALQYRGCRHCFAASAIWYIP